MPTLTLKKAVHKLRQARLTLVRKEIAWESGFSGLIKRVRLGKSNYFLAFFPRTRRRKENLLKARQKYQSALKAVYTIIQANRQKELTPALTTEDLFVFWVEAELQRVKCLKEYIRRLRPITGPLRRQWQTFRETSWQFKLTWGMLALIAAQIIFITGNFEFTFSILILLGFGLVFGLESLLQKFFLDYGQAHNLNRPFLFRLLRRRFLKDHDRTLADRLLHYYNQTVDGILFLRQKEKAAQIFSFLIAVIFGSLVFPTAFFIIDERLPAFFLLFSTIIILRLLFALLFPFAFVQDQLLLRRPFYIPETYPEEYLGPGR